MAKLRHVAVVVRDLEAAARFYEEAFEMKRAFTVEGAAVYLSDGIMNLALLQDKATNSGASNNGLTHGTHHFGFRVEDLKASQERIEARGGKFFFDLGDPAGMNFERKFKDPEGIVFDISEKGWYGAFDEKAGDD
jgi:predicted enzyme related to lactoylglutathione lyase